MEIFIILLLISFSIEQIIKNGIYNIMNNNNYLQYRKRKLFICDYLKYPNTYFRVIKIDKYFNNSFYYIEEISSRYKLSINKNNDLLIPKKNKNNNRNDIWKIIKLKNNNYIIINIKGCYIKINKYNIICENITIEEPTQFNLKKIFEELNENAKEKEVICHVKTIDFLVSFYFFLENHFLLAIKLFSLV